MSPKNTISVLHPASSISTMLKQGSTRISHAKGVHVTDETGNRLIDGTAGLWCASLGHGREEIADTMATAVRSLDYFHTFGGFSNEAQERLGDRLVAMAPAGIDHVFFGSSGSDANDTLIKIVWHYNNLIGRPNKKKIISRWGAYHGTSISSASLTGLKGFHTRFDLPIDRILHTEHPHYYRFAEPEETEIEFTARLISKLAALIESEGPETIAAFIGEPLLGAGGVVPPPAGYWQGVQEICRQNDIMLIADEVVCGFGRTGMDFGSQTFDIAPDMMATAKALTSGVFPMSAAFFSGQIWEVLRSGSEDFGNFSHGYTYSGHPVGAAVANTVLDIYFRENLSANALSVGDYLMNGLKRALSNHPNVGEIRGAGLVCAVQLVEDKTNRTFFDPARYLPSMIAQKAYDRGLIVRPLPSVGALAFSPPLILCNDDADEIINIFSSALSDVLPH